MARLLSKSALKGKVIHLSPPQILALSFLVFIMIGTLLLKLPIASTTYISWIDAMFTATSAITVTGLVVVDTGTDYTVFGQVVIMILIQLGGLGLMTFAVLAVMMLGKKIGLQQRILIQEAMNQTSLGGLIRLVRVLLLFTLMMETIAFILLSIRWVPEFGWREGMYQSLFHTISAFNNAGFSLWSDSLSAYVGDPAVNLIITILFITGGIGFTVLADLWYKKTFRALSLHSKIMLLGTLALNCIAFIAIFILEYANPHTLGGLAQSDRFWGAYFQAVTPRTAGFNTLEIADMTTASIVLILLLMFIGAGSASTASGIKVTTFFVMILATWSFLKGRAETVVFERTIKLHTILRALAIIVISMMIVFIAVFILAITEDAPFIVKVFEVFSAFGTVGLSMGLTGELTTLGKMTIMIVMFIGRVGPLTMAFTLARPKQSNIRYPEDEVFTG
ncbi:TrkH family potassium uptake protein [Halalkalibacterium halodurans]|uniref:TrkH family potassium uptake protein n=1 Tax=Halalkalibacterium halodurans TaxID=86665 RepID=UPI002AA97FF6|nr:TrkH family potassium uptake protein [Halalkalibacterium halodurans]MDY7221092.1 TrkH family potassium uptake protein [Halalkalibacterium halodurans]MDY7240331.1 TrkH family potassium uptake protein [Halalkalibacterium halodurans]MED4083142.1 TrkH family potassium uptake protein [Halalkalibacterium halodurans]MED4086024.1 TrkH family potassium uptake protein [Halalkalibacterium halodurans]MED4106673.1 TrkH family potassium uptake protein [Halalkalibacterium halodurans]